MHEITQQVVETSRPMNRTRVMIVDDHQVVRAGLKTLINGQPDLAVVTEASSGREAMEQLRAHTIDVLLLDLSLPDVSGLDVLKHAKAHYESVGVLILGFPRSAVRLNVLRGGAGRFVGKGTEEPSFPRHSHGRARRTLCRPRAGGSPGRRRTGDPNARCTASCPSANSRFLQTCARRVRVGNRQSSFPEREDSQHLPQSYPRKDVDEE